MERILKLKNQYIGSTQFIKFKGITMRIKEGMDEKLMNMLYDNGFSEYFEVVSSVSLIDDSIEIIDTPQTLFENPIKMMEVTPTPEVKKKSVAVKINNN